MYSTRLTEAAQTTANLYLKLFSFAPIYIKTTWFQTWVGASNSTTRAVCSLSQDEMHSYGSVQSHKVILRQH